MLKIANSLLFTVLDRPASDNRSMPRFSSGKNRPLFWAAIGFAVLLNLGGCASFDPVPIGQVPFKQRAQTKESEEIRLTVAVLSNEETEQVFGLPLADQGVQPVWLEIENRSSKPHMLLTATVDFDYFTPFEIAYPHHGFFSGETNRKIDQFLRDHHFDWYIRPGTTNSGFVYTNLTPGYKYLNIGIYSYGNYQTFRFSAEVPGLETDYSTVDFDKLYAEDEYVSYDEQQLRQVLEAFACCTQNEEGTRDGDPLNLIVIGDGEAIGYAFVSRGWHVTETIHGGTIWKTIQSSLFGSKYRTSPVSALYVFGRPQDLALQKARATIDERNHLRLWRTPWLFNGQYVWIGQISRDVGVKFTLKSPTISTHKVDPNVDEARSYLLQDLAFSGHLKKFGFVSGVGRTTLEENRENLTGDPYFTDGLRAVLVLTKEPTTIDRIERFDWERVIDHLDAKQSKSP